MGVVALAMARQAGLPLRALDLAAPQAPRRRGPALCLLGQAESAGWDLEVMCLHPSACAWASGRQVGMGSADKKVCYLSRSP